MTRHAKKSDPLQPVDLPKTMAVEIPLPLLEVFGSIENSFFELCIDSGQQVLRSMMEQDREDLCGPRWKRDPELRAGRAGTTKSESSYPPPQKPGHTTPFVERMESCHAEPGIPKTSASGQFGWSSITGASTALGAFRALEDGGCTHVLTNAWVSSHGFTDDLDEQRDGVRQLTNEVMGKLS